MTALTIVAALLLWACSAGPESTSARFFSPPSTPPGSGQLGSVAVGAA